MQETPDTASVREAPSGDIDDNDDDLIKDAKKVYKPFASVHHYADFASVSCLESVTCPLQTDLLVRPACAHHTCSCFFMPAQSISEDLGELQISWFYLRLTCLRSGVEWFDNEHCYRLWLLDLKRMRKTPQPASCAAQSATCA